VRVADRQLHPNEAACDERAQELSPERLGFGLADVQSDDLAAAGLMDGVRDDDALARHAATVADLLDLGVDERVRVAALKRSLPERLHLQSAATAGGIVFTVMEASPAQADPIRIMLADDHAVVRRGFELARA
jgi:hypothetical protein